MIYLRLALLLFFFLSLDAGFWLVIVGAILIISSSALRSKGKVAVPPITQATQQQIKRICPQCGYAIYEKVKFCPNCGKSLE